MTKARDDGDLLLVVHDVALDQRHPAPGHAGHKGGAAGPGTQLPPEGNKVGPMFWDLL